MALSEVNCIFLNPDLNLIPESSWTGYDFGAGDKLVYRYHFNGKETDDETEYQDYGFRIYNPALGRFLSVDPLTKSYPMLTPYQFASNTPIMAIDLDGLEATEVVTNTYDEKGTLLKSEHVITIVITVYNESSKVMSSADMKAKTDIIETQFETSSSGTTKDANGVIHDYKVDVQFVQAPEGATAPLATTDNSGNQVEGASGFSLVFVDEVKTAGGGATPAGTTGSTDMIGNTQINRIQIDVNLSDAELRRTGAHELGHALGLQHPANDKTKESSDNTSGNTLSIVTDPNNLMRQSSNSSGTNINLAQRNKISQEIKNDGKSVTKTVGQMQQVGRKVGKITPTK